MQVIKFCFHDRLTTLKNRRKLRSVIEGLFIKERKKLKKLTYVFCSDSYLIGINKEFLKHDFYTDIITFDLSSSKGEIEGEVYISVDRVKDNAVAVKTTVKNEMQRVIFHGALHLCGYKDKKKKDTAVMRIKEEEYLKQL